MLRFGSLALCAFLAACSAARPELPPDSRAPEGALRVDLHLHVAMDSAAGPLFRGRSGDVRVAGAPGTILRNQVDVETLVHSGLRLALGSVWPPFRLRPGLTARDDALHQLSALRDFTRETPGFALASSSGQARRLLGSGLVVLIPAVEGGEGITRVEDVDLYYAAGARVLTLIHFVDSALGGAAEGQVSQALGATPEGTNPKGLTPLGEAVVRRMVELGMIIDLAHASDQSVREVLAITTPLGVPVIDSHAAARALGGGERNLSDELAREIAKGGGIIGVTLYGAYVASEDATCDDVVSHWKHFAQVAGPANVVLGSDLNGFISRPGPGGACPRGIRHTGDLPWLFGALRDAGIPSRALDGAGERLLRLWEAVEARADDSAQARARARSVPAARMFEVPL